MSETRRTTPAPTTKPDKSGKKKESNMKTAPLWIALAALGIVAFFALGKGCDNGSRLDTAEADVESIGQSVVGLQKEADESKGWRATMEEWRVDTDGWKNATDTRLGAAEQLANSANDRSKRAIGTANAAANRAATVAKRLDCPKGSTLPWPQCLGTDEAPKGETDGTPPAASGDVGSGRTRVHISRTYRVIPNS